MTIKLKTAFGSIGRSRKISKRKFGKLNADRGLTFEPLEDRRVLAAWISQGPSPILNGQVEKVSPNNEVVGAIHDVLAHPTDADTLYIGTVNGGVWRTTNATSASPNWQPLTDDLSSLSIGALDMDPDDPDRLMAGIGHFSTFGELSEGGALTGVLLSEDGGDSWIEISDPLLVEENISGVAVRGDVLIAAASGGYLIGPPDFNRGGIFRSTDGGDTWTSLELLQRDPLAPEEPIIFSVLDLVGDPTDPNRLYAAVADVGIFRSNDAGASWVNTTMSDQSPGGIDEAITLPGPGFNNNTQLAVASDGRLYAGVVEDGVLEYVGFADGQGSVWMAMDLPLTPEATAGGLDDTIHPGFEGGIHFSIAVDPNDFESVFVGGDRQGGTVDFATGNFIGANDFSGRLFRGDAFLLPTGANPSPQWEHLTHRDNIPAIQEGGTANKSAPHAGSHDMVFDANGDLIEVDGGGIYRRTNPEDNTGDWFSLNGNLQITEFHDVAYDSNSNIIIGGTQNVGTPQQVSPGSNIWAAVNVKDLPTPFRLNADGGDVAVDDTSMPGFSIRYSSTQNAGFIRRQIYDARNIFIEQEFLNLPAGFTPAFLTPIELNKLDQRRLIVGGLDTVYESFDRGNTFVAVAGLGTPSLLFGQNAIVYGGRRGGIPNPDLLYVGSADEVFVRTERGEPLELTVAQFPGGDVRDIVVDPDNWATAFVVDKNRVYRTTDAGSSWRDVSGNLNALGAGELRSLEFIPTSDGDIVVVGGSTGVFTMSTRNTGSWSELGTDLPNVVAYDLDYDAADDVLVVGTQGRGVWIMPDITGGGVVPPGPGGGGGGPAPNSISGTKFNDLNGNGLRDSGEGGLAGWTIYIDVNRNGVLNASEPSTVTGGGGQYTLSNVPAGTHVVAEVQQAGWSQSAPAGSGVHTVNLSGGQGVSGVNFGNRRQAGSVSGTMWNDLNGNGERDEGEAGVKGLTVYVDVDGSGVLGLGEPFAISDVNGDYQITNAPEGRFRVRQARTPGWIETSGPSGPVNIVAGEDVGGLDFGQMPEFDRGDAPHPYPTLDGDNGPVHGIDFDFFLGSNIDGEADGMPHPVAHGDDENRLDDDDGVIFLTGLQPGETEEVAVFATQLSVSRAYLHAWLDYNADGDFDDAGEHIFKNRRLDDGVNVLTFDVPAGAQADATVARFRWALERDLSHSGPALAGEVEDYGVSIPMEADDGLVAVNDTFSAVEDSANNPLDVLANDFSSFGENLSIVSVGATSNGGTVSNVDGARLSYTPAPDFFGTETFTYTIEDDLGAQDQATVLVTATNVNDDPTAMDDEFDVAQDSRNNILPVLENDSILPDVGETLTITELGPTSAGGTVTLSAGATSVTYLPRSGFLGTDTFTYMISDGNGGTDEATVTVNVVELPDVVRFRLETTDLAGTPISNISEGGSFQLRGFVEDIRPEPTGVFSAYLDVAYDNTAIVTVDGAIQVQNPYNRNVSGTARAGLLDEVGAFDGDTPLGGGEFHLFTVAFNATGAGTVNFASNQADNVPLHDVAVYFGTTAVRPIDISFGTAAIEITESGARDDQFTVEEDSIDNPLDVLANDDLGGPDATRIVTDVGDPDQGGMASIAGESSLLYTPAPDFFGTETFTYNVADDQGNTGSATVTVTVANVNDPPTANDDNFAAERTSSNNVLTVLSNDSFAPDPPERLSIQQVGAPSQGGTAARSADAQTILYTPRDGFTGTETFTYTIEDEAGATDQANVTVVVTGVEQVVRFHLQTTDADGNPIEAVAVGETFLLNVAVEDIRSQPTGVFAAYLDVAYNAPLVSPSGGINFTSTYFNFRRGNVDVPGVIDEAGAFDGNTPLGGGVFDVFIVPFIANEAGQVTFAGNEPDDPVSEILLYGGTSRVPSSQVDFGQVTITVATVAPFQNALRPADVNADGLVTPLDALHVINELNENGARSLPPPAQPGVFRALSASPPSFFVDVSGDNFVSPLDALLVINELNVSAQNNRIAVPAASVPRAALSASVEFDSTQSFNSDVLTPSVTADNTSGPAVDDASAAGHVQGQRALARRATRTPRQVHVAAQPEAKAGSRNLTDRDIMQRQCRLSAGALQRARLGRGIASSDSIEEAVSAIADDIAKVWQHDAVARTFRGRRIGR